PALAERQRDLPKVAAHLLATASSRLEKAVHHIPDHVMDAILAHPWPGNVRELENALTRAVALARGPSITLDGLGLSGAQVNDTGAPSPSDAADPFTTDGGVPERGHSEHAPE